MILRFLLALSVVVTGAGLGGAPAASGGAAVDAAGAFALPAVDEPTAGVGDDPSVVTAALVVASAADAEEATAETFGAGDVPEQAPDPAASPAPAPSPSPSPSASPTAGASPTQGTSSEPESGDDVARTAEAPEPVRVTEDEVADAARVDPDAEPVVADALTVDERVVTPAVETPAAQTIGVTWPQDADGDDLAPQVRTLVGDTWSDWTVMEVGDTAPDPGTADATAALRGGTDSFWIGDVDAIQLSFAATTAGGPEDLALALIGSDPASPAAADGAQGAASAGDAVFRTALASSESPAVVQTAAAPSIITRAQWGARAPVCTPDTAGSLVGAVVHHTAGGNSYSSKAQAMEQIRNDQRYHIESRGWCDIGYNFIVDKFGNIYEGRVGSMTKPVIGVHAGGFNTGTVGVAMLGTYDAAPSAATVDAVGRVIGWRLGQYYRDPQGSMSYTTGNGENSRYKNTTVTLPRVFGHRDVAFTACPGNGGYSALGAIRAVAAANLVPPISTAEARAVVKALYRDLLGRSVDPSGMDTWSRELLSGKAPAAVVDALTRSTEYRRLRIQQAYLDVFGRTPDEGGLRQWVSEVASGRVGVDDVKRRLLDSGEFLSRAGGTPEGYVARLYSSVLKREGSASEIASWADRYRSIGRSAVATAIWGSKESAMRRVEVYYPQLLGRPADRGGLETWSGVLLREGEQSVRNGMAASGEYRKRAVARFP